MNGPAQATTSNIDAPVDAAIAAAEETSEWRDADIVELVVEGFKAREEGNLLLDRADLLAAVVPIVVELHAREAASVEAEMAARLAADAVTMAEAALVMPDAAIAEAEQRVRDLDAARMAETAADAPDLAKLKHLVDDIAAYEAIRRDLVVKRVAPADQLVAAQREAKRARDSATAAQTAVDEQVKQLADPLCAPGPARRGRILRTALDIVVRSQAGKPVHPEDLLDAAAVIHLAAGDLGFVAAAEALGAKRERDAMRQDGYR